MTLPRWFEDFRHTKAYDFIVAVPLIVWFGKGAWEDAQNLTPHLAQIKAGTETTIGYLQVMAVVGSILFCTLLVAMLVLRTVPRARASGILPRVFAIAGTGLGTGFLYLTPVALPLWLQVLAIVLIVAAAGLEIAVMMWLGRSFAIMAEARKLVTGGPYAAVRHPLYVAEAIGMAAMLIQFFSPAAIGLYVAFLAAQVVRAVFEERILTEAFPDYGAYAARTARFIPFVY